MAKQYVISDQTIAMRNEKIRRRILKEARCKVKRGELRGEGIALYLPHIDEKYNDVKNEIRNAIDGRIAQLNEEYQLHLARVERNLETFDNDLRRLNAAQLNIEKEAEKAGIPHDKRDVTEVTYKGLHDRFNKLKGGEE